MAVEVEASVKPDFKRDIEEVEYYTNLFCRRVCLRKEELVVNNLNPVLDYVNWLRFLRRNPTKQQIDKYKDYLVYGQLQTGLRERNHAAKSAIKYVMRDGKIYNDRFAGEPFENVLNRGLEWSRNNNSSEIERDEADVQGWKNAIEFLIAAPTNAKAIQITGHGIVEGTHHGHNFVDIYEKIIDSQTGEWIIRMTRNASALSYPQYREIALKKDPCYFDGFQGPEDAWYTKHVFKVYPDVDSREVNQIFEEDFGLPKGTMTEDRFERVFQKTLPIGINYTRILCISNDPVEIVKALQAVLVKNDLAIVFGTSGTVGSTGMFGKDEEIAWLARQPVAAISVGCGISSGFNIFGLGGCVDYLGLSNSVGKFGISSGEHKWFICPRCGYMADGPVGNACPKNKGGCGLTKEAYSQSGGKVC